MGGRKWLKSQEWQMFLLFFLQICSNPMFLAAADTNGEIFCKDRELEVQSIAKKAVENAGGLSCELINSCTSKNCSRAACFGLHSDISRSECRGLADTVGNCSCNSIRANYERSYMRIPSLTDDLNSIRPEVSTSICLQRPLDTTFKAFARNATFYKYYFGSVDGTFRFYPGVESNTCVGYDPRVRPWYTGAISVIKHLVVLVDVSSTMDTVIGFVQPTTCMEGALDMTRSLLNTLSGGDNVTVISYSNDSTAIIGSFHVQGASLNTSDNRFNQLLEEVGNTTIRDDVEYSNITAGISGAVSALGSSDALKVLVVFTNGKSPLPPEEVNALARVLNTSAINLFIYQIKEMDVGLTQLACNVTVGHTEKLTIDPVLNPLYGLKAYFSFVALNRQAANPEHLAFWQKPYQDFDVLGDVITVAFPAISPSGELVGVAGVDVQVAGIPSSLWTEINPAVDTRIMSPPKPPPIVKAVTNGSCGIVVNNGSLPCIVQNAYPVCQKTGKNYTYQQLLCCPECGGLEITAKSKLIILWICLGVAGACALVVGVVWALKRFCRPAIPPPPPAGPKQPKVAPLPEIPVRL